MDATKRFRTTRTNYKKNIVENTYDRRNGHIQFQQHLLTNHNRLGIPMGLMLPLLEYIFDCYYYLVIILVSKRHLIV